MTDTPLTIGMMPSHPGAIVREEILGPLNCHGRGQGAWRAPRHAVRSRERKGVGIARDGTAHREGFRRQHGDDAAHPDRLGHRGDPPARGGVPACPLRSGTVCAMRARRRAASGETNLIERLRAGLAEVEDIAGEEMRLHLTDLALERARLALDVPAAFASPQPPAPRRRPRPPRPPPSSPKPATTAATPNSPRCTPASRPPERAAAVGSRPQPSLGRAFQRLHSKGDGCIFML